MVKVIHIDLLLPTLSPSVDFYTQQQWMAPFNTGRFLEIEGGGEVSWIFFRCYKEDWSFFHASIFNLFYINPNIYYFKVYIYNINMLDLGIFFRCIHHQYGGELFFMVVRFFFMQQPKFSWSSPSSINIKWLHP